MVRLASSFLGAAVLLSSYVSAAAIKRQDPNGDIVPAIPVAAGGLSTIDPNAIPTADDTAGNSVEFPTETNSVDIPEESSNSVEFPPTETSSPEQQFPPEQQQHNQYNQPQYGSGSNNGWHSGYNDCVQTCFASNPLPATVVTLPPSGGESSQQQDGGIENNGGEVSGGGQQSNNGNGLEILVEPVNGALRFVPAFVNAAVGQTVRFRVVNGQHAVAQSNPITPCNATAGGFQSQNLNQGQTFDVPIANTDPIFFFSSTDGECQQGMFGGINAATGLEGSQTTVNALMPQWANANPDIQAALDATNTLAAQTPGLLWAGKVDTAPIAPEFYPQLANNILFTRAVIARNPEMVDTNGVFRPSGALSVPQDISMLIATADAGGYGTSDGAQAALNGPTAPAADNAAANPTDAPGDGAGSIISSSRVAIGAVTVLGAMLFL